MVDTTYNTVPCEACGGSGADAAIACDRCYGLGWVVDLGTPKLERTISKTQLESFRNCERKWGWYYLERLRSSNRYAQLGIEVHELLENWLRHGIAPSGPNAAIADAGLHLIPAPQSPHTMVESEIFFIDPVVGWYRGFADWIEPPEARDDGIPVVGDHKTTGNFRWALKPEDLQTDIQACIYARATMSLFGTDKCRLRWVYYRTKGKPASRLVETVITLEQVEKVFRETIHPIATRLQNSLLLPVLELEANVKSCSLYGGCSYRSNCNLDANSRFLSLMAKSSLLSRIKAKAAAPSAEPEPAPETEDAAKTTASINPPKPKGGSLMDKVSKKKAAKASPKASSSPAKAAAPASAPSKAKAKETPKKVQEEPPAAAGSVILCLGCVPMGVPYTDGRAIVRKVATLLEAELDLPDYRLADYGKGTAMLGAGVRRYLAQNPLSGFVFLDMRCDEGKHTVSAFEDAATIVVRGVW